MIKNTLTGTGVALVTPFTQNKSLDVAGLNKLVQHVIQGRVEYLVVMGTTGEAATLSKDEKKQVLEIVLEINDGRLPIVLGVGGNNTSQLIEDLKNVTTDGLTAILSVSPYYNKPSQSGIIAHYTALADASPLPIILYNVPSRTGSNVTAATTLTLAAHPNIVGMKEASGDLMQCMELAAHASFDFALISGDDLMTPSLIGMGFVGAISVLANAYPMEFSTMVRHALETNPHSSYKEAFKLLNINSLMYKEGNPTGIKALLQSMGICEASVRLPMADASKELAESIANAHAKKKEIIN